MGRLDFQAEAIVLKDVRRQASGTRTAPTEQQCHGERHMSEGGWAAANAVLPHRAEISAELQQTG
jgi:hypothetical protein